MKNLINLFTLILFLFPLCILAQCFDEVADEVGVTGYWGIPSGIPGGGGLSFVDYNQDGYDDLTFTSSRQQNISFFTNNGDGTFTLEDPPFITNIWESKSVVWVDWDNDGDKDLYVTTRYVAGRFYENDGNMNFTDITADIGLDEVDGTSWGANFGDYDMDGYIDLYLTRYGYTQAGGLDTNMMFRNIEGTHFEDVTFETGTAEHCSSDYGFSCTGEEGRLSFCSVFYDMDLDGDQDIYVSNDHTLHANTIYENNGDGTFTDVSEITSGNITIYSMNAGVGDSNGDGYFDLFSTDTQQASHLIYDDATNSYIEDADNLGTSLSSYGWGASFFDYDNDQDLDLYVCIRSEEYEDPNAFLVNDGTGSYTEPLGDSGGLGSIDHEISHCVATGDFNLDGFLDLAVTHSGFDIEHHVWKSCETNDTTNYVKFKLTGTLSNKDAYGARIDLYTGEVLQRTQKLSQNGYLSQNSDIITMGLGAFTEVDSVIITWPFPNSITKVYSNDIVINEINEIEEDETIDCPIGGACDDGDDCTYNDIYDADCNCLGIPTVEGIACDDNDDCTENDVYNANCECIGDPITGDDSDGDGISDECDPCPDDPNIDCTGDFPTVDPDLNIVRKWNELLLESIRLDLARPTVHARNLFHTSIAMWDSYSIYNDPACPYLIGNSVDGYNSSFDEFNYVGDLNENLEATISYACYRLLSHRFANSPNAEILQEAYDYLMGQLGYDIEISSTDYSTGEGANLGNFIGEELINFGLLDGSNEEIGYDNEYYEPVNDPLDMGEPGNPLISDYNRWQPLTLETYIDQSGNIIPIETPGFLSPEWGQVSNFALEEEDLTSYFRDGFEYKVYHDPTEPPYLNLDGSDDTDIYQWGFTLVSKWSSHLDPNDGVMIDISPASLGNPNFIPTDFSDYDQFYLDEGGNPASGYNINPYTGMPYAQNIVARGDYSRVLAEFWADGPDSETPPGHWFTLLNYVSDQPELEKRFEGEGPVLEDTEWYVKSYLAMGGAMHDAAVSAWGVKGWYDYIRPVSAIRAMADLGQSTDPNLSNYHPAGLPLTDGLVELVMTGDPLAGANDEHVNKIKLYAWLGHDEIVDPEIDEAGVGWILAENWVPYQRASFVTPPFAGYVSGHSTFSRAAAEVMTMLTGDEYFPGGLGTFLAEEDEFLVFEDGPSMDIELQWATYRDAAEQSAMSRIWGGIHPPFDDIPGREIGLVVGTNAFNKTKQYFEDSDNDDLCDPLDLCDNFDNNLIGTPCDDGDICTDGETYSIDCQCTGGDFIDEDEDGVCLAEDPDDNDPCNPDENHPNCSTCDYSVLSFDDFEGDESDWTDRGFDVLWDEFSQADSGDKCFRIQDDSGLYSAMQFKPQDFTAYDKLLIEFTFITEGFSDGESISLLISTAGFSNTTELETWEYGVDFENDIREYIEFEIVDVDFGAFTSLWLESKGSDDSDQAFVDDVTISGCMETFMPGSEEVSARSQFKVNIYPNPMNKGSNLILENSQSKYIENVSLSNMQGQIVYDENLNREVKEYELDTQFIEAGIYFIRIEMLNGESITKRVLIL